MGVHVAKRGVVTMTTVVQEVAKVTRLGRETPECHLSEKFNPEIKNSYLHTNAHTPQSRGLELVSESVCVVIACGSSCSVLSRLPVNSNESAG